MAHEGALLSTPSRAHWLFLEIRNQQIATWVKIGRIVDPPGVRLMDDRPLRLVAILAERNGLQRVARLNLDSLARRCRAFLLAEKWQFHDRDLSLLVRCYAAMATC